jgi:nicotinate-nucleotide adenylyltransferase
MNSNARPLLLLLGGSFNPPHSGHLRIVIESAERLHPAETHFLPCAVPPHKSGRELLPFALRADMLRAAIEDIAPDVRSRHGFAVNEMENERHGPSYTIETLRLLSARRPDRRLAFIMGSEDFSRLVTWRDWPLLPEFADIIVLPRAAGAAAGAEADARRMWPEARVADKDGLPEDASAFVLPSGGKILYLPQPVFDLSSSLVRERFLAGRSLDFLVPPRVGELMYRHEKTLQFLWSGP